MGGGSGQAWKGFLVPAFLRVAEIVDPTYPPFPIQPVDKSKGVAVGFTFILMVTSTGSRISFLSVVDKDYQVITAPFEGFIPDRSLIAFFPTSDASIEFQNFPITVELLGDWVQSNTEQSFDQGNLRSVDQPFFTNNGAVGFVVAIPGVGVERRTVWCDLIDEEVNEETVFTNTGREGLPTGTFTLETHTTRWVMNFEDRPTASEQFVDNEGRVFNVQGVERNDDGRTVVVVCSRIEVVPTSNIPLEPYTPPIEPPE